MLRFGFVLLITALPQLGMEAMSTRRETTKQLFDDQLIHSESRVVSNWRCQVARRSGDVSPPSNQTPVRARDTAT